MPACGGLAGLLARGPARFDHSKFYGFYGLVLAIAPLVACASPSAEIGDASGTVMDGPARDADMSDELDAAVADGDDAKDAGGAASAAKDASLARADAGRASADAAAAARDSGSDARVPTLFYLDITGERVLRADPVARTSREVATKGSNSPDGIAVDAAHGVIYWTNMGVPEQNDGFVLRADLSGANVGTVVAKAATFTPKQLQLEAASGLLYWSDREGMRVMRARVDGSGLETLVTTGSGDAARADASNWAVGIAVDAAAQKIYWTQKGPDNGHQGSIRRAGLELLAGEDSAHRSDIEILFAGLPEPVDLELDVAHGHIYWTDRGDNTISRAPLDAPPGVAADKRTDRAILVRNAGEAIGIALDVVHDAMYYTTLEGTVSKTKLDGSAATTLLRGQGALTGITYVELPR